MRIFFALAYAALIFGSYPELEWLRASDVEATADYGHTSSETEFLRTEMSLKCLNWILTGDYESFTGKGKNNLSRDDFGTLCKRAQKLKETNPYGLTLDEMDDVMRSCLVLGDIGKTKEARRRFPELERIEDHDLFFTKALEILRMDPSRCPTFEKLKSKQLLYDTAHLVHYGHICHVEGGPKMFEPLLKDIDPWCLEFDLLIQRCDVAGAAGHVEKDYSLVYDANVHFAMEGVQKACLCVVKHKDPEKALLVYLKHRGDPLKLNANGHYERTLIRLACMLRLYYPDEAYALKTAALDPALLAAFDPLKGRPGPTPTYMPAVLCNLRRHHGITYALKYGLPALLQILNTQSGQICFNGLARQINQNPYCLERQL